MTHQAPTPHRARKRFGQNFLRDPGIIDRLVRSIHPVAGDRLVEIGPGQGALTEGLLNGANALDVIELDRDLIPGLKTQFFNYPEFRVHQGDALAFDFRALAAGERLRVVGNLPYNISTPLIFKLLEVHEVVEDMHFMLQKEVVERLAARPGGGQWGRLSILAQYHCQVDHLFDVPPEAFVPRPKVDSAIVRLRPYKTSPFEATDPERLARLVKQAFSQRRKTLRNNLKPLMAGEAIEALEIDPGKRPEALTLDEYIRLTNALPEEPAHDGHA
ncbi:MULTISPECIES: 16S rRNA (adenine(1518)-N(6)/adenine(1519)-N(6))-dimethyltransferase RsmA [Larsenimonas]|uniref:Ribosomal RNA small subunit methyltransferase A n=1 Tax=Larsenimonas suaedae TaxID=1851019 RepID=A0ABU1GTQ1_9GAMM|nr:MULTISPECIES: 16S rRNA (adenine(1518)-N(6)/adenine(1519)-N(6))-dimethyltransferase RsmA [Larsenimonas]MCM2971829.1 16S rRNA (adenine(1518)-N(6)/adenine(1519)-N(6))-dimethyltransferase RsmA [Larsenimonas suaedae]MCM5703907.1 16S rRNA (adenine(1518)-N(6)/adenine(1519)-N(6))-dimethyltransferase RsmA [Larsenimonas salina]MDR5895381.1 16S rRNA (adenine(1518)-N(6)/adenine(1519)-N(6))-dimethyltransferase RsmA [Larsenimonas suaedae]